MILHSIRSRNFKSDAVSSSLKYRSNDSYPYYFDPEVIIKQYSISPKPCWEFFVTSSKPSLAVIIVFIRADGFARRDVIRQTWGSLSLMKGECGVRRLFMIGRIRSPQVQLRILQEAQEHGDIIQSNQFDDQYRSAAIKAINLLQWGATFCPNTKYIAKIDDDNWLNVPKYVDFLKSVQHTDHVYGAVFPPGSTGPVIRHPMSKYYVPREEFEPDYYGAYLSGILYAFPTRLIGRVLHQATKMRLTFNDDVMVPGILTSAANVTRADVPDYSFGYDEAVQVDCPKREFMCIHYTEMADFKRLWDDPCHVYKPIC